jgi:thiol:disulfide interchange protein
MAAGAAARAPAAAKARADVAAAGANAAAAASQERPRDPGVAVPEPLTLWAALLLAFAGGLILNLMPCVFPVLSLKVLGFLHVAHHEAARVRRHGYAFTAGVLLSFWILAGLLLVLRAAGGVLGWGFQLQEPLFVAFLAALLLAMSLNLLGVFEVGASVTGAVGRLDSRAGYRGSFLSGALATVLATPCSAPFMGTAVGYALLQPASVSLAVFTALGAGMAAPYLVLACVPALLRGLPRPGPWMERFREAMAFPLLATVAWLVWVFGQQTGNDAVLQLLLALLLGASGAWIAGRFATEKAGRLPRALSLVCVAGAAWLMVVASAEPKAAPCEAEAIVDHGGGVSWQPWNPDAIAAHRREGRAVFVDFTADWCLSCKANERVALSGEQFAARLRETGTVAMKADWTSADARVTEALASFGRSGVPLYVVYPADPAREPVVLPQLLTPDLVAEALRAAAA